MHGDEMKYMAEAFEVMAAPALMSIMSLRRNSAVDEYENRKIGDLCWFSHYTELVYSQAAYDEFLKDYFRWKEP